MIDDLIAYVARYSPDHPARIVGASDEAIAALEAAVGGPLPAAYREFLRAMGVDQGGLDFAFGGEMDVASITEMVVEYSQPGAIPLVKGCENYCLVGICPGGYQIVLSPRDVPTPPAYLAEGVLGRRCADSFEALLFQSAFFCFAESRHAVSLFFQMTPETTTFDAIASCVRSLGFTLERGSDSIVLCAERPDATLSAVRYSSSRGSVRLTADSDRTFQALREALSDVLALTPFQKPR